MQGAARADCDAISRYVSSWIVGFTLWIFHYHFRFHVFDSLSSRLTRVLNGTYCMQSDSVKLYDIYSEKDMMDAGAKLDVFHNRERGKVEANLETADAANLVESPVLN
jgi:hypothetical protein